MTNLLVLYTTTDELPQVLKPESAHYSELLEEYKKIINDPPKDAYRVELWRSGPGRIRQKRLNVEKVTAAPTPAKEPSKEAPTAEEPAAQDKEKSEKPDKSKPPTIGAGLKGIKK